MPTICQEKHVFSYATLAMLVLLFLAIGGQNTLGQTQSNFGILGNANSNPSRLSYFQPDPTPIYDIGSPRRPRFFTTSAPIASSSPIDNPTPQNTFEHRPIGAYSSSSSLSSIPDMFGDFFGGRPPAGLNNNGLPPRGGAGTRSVKLSENFSPQPRTRLFTTYHFFNDVLDGSFGDVNRYTFGMELANETRTRSIDIRLPIANTLSSLQVNERPLQKDTELGNLTVILKQVLLSGPDSLISGGLGIAVPTADDGSLLRPGDNREILRVGNEAVHLLPFLGFVNAAGPRFFTQGFLQLDIDASGNPVFGDVNAFNLRPLGVVQDPTLLFADLGVGYRVFENRSSRAIESMSIAAEIHYATTVQDTDRIDVAGFTVGDITRRFDVLNFTVGTNLGNRNSILRPGFVIPLIEGDDRQFDYEVFLQFNHYF